MAKPFEGIKVVELTAVVAGPCVGRLLADLGAEVIKIEKISGDSWRYSSIARCPDEFSHDENPVYDLYNSRKKHISIDIKTPQGREVFDRLLDDADVFLTNTRKAGRHRGGFDYEDIKEKHPRLIYAVIDGFGDKGPDKDMAAYDTNSFWARCGLLLDQAVLPDEGEGPYFPVQPPFSVGDTFTGFLLFGEISAALYQREKTGRGQFVKAGLFHTGVFAFSTMEAYTQRPFGEKRPMKIHEHRTSGGVFQCKDGKYVFFTPALISNAHRELLEAAGWGDVLKDSRFADDAARNKNKKATYEKAKEIALSKTRAEWIALFKSFGIPIAPANGYADVSEDEQALANGFIRDVTYKNGHTIKLAASPFEMESLDPAQLDTRPASKQGADNETVLKAAGYSDKEIKELYELGVITRKD